MPAFNIQNVLQLEQSITKRNVDHAGLLDVSNLPAIDYAFNLMEHKMFYFHSLMKFVVDLIVDVKAVIHLMHGDTFLQPV